MTVFKRFQWRRRLAADWVTENEVMLQGEAGLETDTFLFKLGDGVTAWNDLPYAGGGWSGSDPGAIHVGDAAGGDLMGTYPNPTVDPAILGASSFSLLTDGDPEEPELIFADGDVIVTTF